MPIRFRCPGCEGLLSIATRKAGAEIGCPKCGEALLVPPPPEPDPVPDPTPTPKRSRAETFENARTEVDLSSPNRRPEPAGVGAGVASAKPERRGGPAVREFLAGDEPPLPAAKPEESKPKAKPKPPKPGDEPLFERSDFERLLDPAVKKAAETAEASKSDATKPQPTLPAAAISTAEAIKLGLPVAEDGVYVGRGTAVMLGMLFVFLLGLAFAVGFWAGS